MTLKIRQLILPRHPKGASDHRRTARRAAVAVAMIATALGLVSRCEFDGGLLDRNSAASREHASQQQAVEDRVNNSAYVQAHKSDVRTDIVTFSVDICGLLGEFHHRVEAAGGDEAPKPIDVAVRETVTALEAIAAASDDAAHHADALIAPAVDPILEPGTDLDIWSGLRSELAADFRAAATDLRLLQVPLVQGYPHADTSLVTTLADTAHTAGARLTALNEAMSSVISRMPIPNPETVTAVRASAVCMAGDA